VTEGALTRIVRRNREERRRECENPDAGSRVTGYFDAFVERASTQRGFNYADITVIKPINACYCAPSGGPQRLSRFLSTVPTTSLLHKSTPPSVGIQGRILPAVESSLRPPRRRGKATTKNGEENKHSDSPDPVDDTQTVVPSTGDANVGREESSRILEWISHGEIISFDRSTRSEADRIQWRETLRAALFLRLLKSF